MKNTQSYSYEGADGWHKGTFCVYQAKNGAIYLMMAQSVTQLTYKQVNELNIPVYDLKDFDQDDFKAFYNL